MTNPDVPNFNPGAVLDRVDLRDHQWPEVGYGTAPFDWNVGFDIEAVLRLKLLNNMFKIPVKDQDGSGSCGGQAGSYYGEVLEAYYTGTFEERSAKFIYSQVYMPPAGSNMRDVCDLICKQGWAREAVLTSYQGGNPPGEAFMQRSQDVTDVVRQDASKAKGLSYANVGLSIDEIAQAVRDNKGVIIGIVGSNNGTWNSPFPQPPTMADDRWYHWVYIGKAKMINGKKHVGFINSWGSACGDQGWQWISEDYINRLLPGDSHGGKAVWTVWTILYNEMPTPEPGFSHNFQVNLSLNQSGEEVIALQKALKIDGEFPMAVPATGFYGDVTRRAVLAFQLKYKVDTVTELNRLAGKTVGPKTRAQLNLLFNK